MPTDCQRVTWSSTCGHSAVRPLSARESNTSASSAPLAKPSATPLSNRFVRQRRKSTVPPPAGATQSTAISITIATAAAMMRGCASFYLLIHKIRLYLRMDREKADRLSVGNYFLLPDRLWISRIRLEDFGEPRSGFGRAFLSGVFAVKPDAYAQVYGYVEWIDYTCLFEGGFDSVKADVGPAEELKANVVKFGLGIEGQTEFCRWTGDVAFTLLEKVCEHPGEFRIVSIQGSFSGQLNDYGQLSQQGIAKSEIGCDRSRHGFSPGFDFLDESFGVAQRRGESGSVLEGRK